jgi:hypothetical protein
VCVCVCLCVCVCVCVCVHWRVISVLDLERTELSPSLVLICLFLDVSFPHRLTALQIEAYFAAIPKQCVPLIGTGARVVCVCVCVCIFV